VGQRQAVRLDQAGRITKGDWPVPTYEKLSNYEIRNECKLQIGLESSQGINPLDRPQLDARIAPTDFLRIGPSNC